jgi:hypothetical protein
VEEDSEPATCLAVRWSLDYPVTLSEYPSPIIDLTKLINSTRLRCASRTRIALQRKLNTATMFNFTPLLGAQSASSASQSLLEFDGGIKILIDVGWDESFDVAKLKEVER